MRMETLWQGERRTARRVWWTEVLDGEAAANWEEVLDEMVVLRFQVNEVAGGDAAERTGGRSGRF